MISRRSAVKGGLAATIATGGAIGVSARAEAREDAAEAAYPPEGDILDVGGVSVHAVVRGTGPDLVLLHGASGNVRDFTFSLVDRLASDYRVIAFDRPGLGYTGRTDPAYARPFASRAETPREQADLLRQAARQLGADRPIVLGHSFGGAVALAWAAYAPDTLSALVCVAAAAMEWEGGLGPLYALTSSAPGGALLIPALTAFVPESYLDQITTRIFAPDPVPEGYREHIGAPLTLRRDSLRANARQVNGLKPHIVAQQALYPRINVPVEWVHGTADTTVPLHVHGEPFSEIVPQTNLTRLSGVGHMPQHAAPEEVVAAIHRARDRAA
ncbi:MAG: alpha/beta hydrolase [Pseudomonadota bacterium]